MLELVKSSQPEWAESRSIIPSSRTESDCAVDKEVALRLSS